MRVVHLKIHFLIRFWSDHNEISMANSNIDALYVGSLRIKHHISFLSNFTSYKWCVTKVAHCIAYQNVIKGYKNHSLQNIKSKYFLFEL